MEGEGGRRGSRRGEEAGEKEEEGEAVEEKRQKAILKCKKPDFNCN